MSTNISEIISSLIDIGQIDYNREYSKLAKLHKYWSRKPWYIIQNYISKYSKENQLIVDPFCGSGLIGLEAILQNRNYIGYDLNPFAKFLADNTLAIKFDPKVFDQEYQFLENKLKHKIMDLYKYNENYLLYFIAGPKNLKDYNAVICDYNFSNKNKITIDRTEAIPVVTFPFGLSYPDKPFPEKFYKDRFSYKGVKLVSDMFSKRNLLALAIIFTEIQNSSIQYKNLFMLAFTNTLLHTSKLKAENVRPLSVNNFWIPDDFIEENVWWRFSERIANVRIAKTTLLDRIKDNNVQRLGSYRIHDKSSLHMAEINSSSVDYVFTDPPYGDAIQYSELSYIWNCWLEKDFAIKDEVIINPVQNKGIDQYSEQMDLFIREVHRILKEDGVFTLCFHNKDSKIWLNLSKILKDTGFDLVNIATFDTFGSPYNKSWAKFSPKSDLYITFQKRKNPGSPKRTKKIYPEDIAKDICSYLINHNGKDFNLTKAYDLFVAAMITNIMNGYVIIDCDKLNIKSIVALFEKVIKSGNIQGRLPSGI